MLTQASAPDLDGHTQEMEVHDPPYPEYREQGAWPTHDYRIVFWQHQLPPPGSDISVEQMGWSELTRDVVGAEDVHEVIAWAESHIDEYTDPEGHSERTYILYAKVPDEPWMLHLAGVDPTVQPVHNTFRRHHPLPA